jgi:heme exporter protein D|tara:strand:- start:58 stop:291 length:234 start_codon:yes stop_codon:yes gene_type:complete
MISEIISMNGYGLYVWSAFSFTLLSFGSLFLVTKLQLLKEQKRFVSKFGSLNIEKIRVAKLQNINKEILTNTLNSKI